MREQERRRLDAAGRERMRSPGRPPAARRGERQRFWAAIARGLPGEDAAVVAGVSPAVGTRWFRQAGGMPPIAQSALSGRYLSLAEREEIAILRARGCGVRDIARRAGRSASTISRELRRNAATRGGCLEYRATTAQWHADRRARRPKAAKLAVNEPLRRYVEERLSGAVRRPDGACAEGPSVRWIGRRHGRRADRRWAIAWSPEQIANRLRVDFPDDDCMRISHEAIYQALYVQGRGALRRELTACLRTGRALRVPRARARGRGKGFVSPEIMISQRPAVAADRAVPGHWEGDLIVGLNSSAIGTLVERTTRFTMLLHLPPMEGHGGPRAKNGPALAGHGAEAVRDAIAASITTLPGQLRRSLTCASTPAWRSTSATRTVPGSGAATRTPTDCCASTSRREPTSPGTAPMTSPRLPRHSTAAPARLSAGGPRQKPSTNCCTHAGKAVSRRPALPRRGRPA